MSKSPKESSKDKPVETPKEQTEEKVDEIELSPRQLTIKGLDAALSFVQRGTATDDYSYLVRSVNIVRSLRRQLYPVVVKPYLEYYKLTDLITLVDKTSQYLPCDYADQQELDALRVIAKKQAAKELERRKKREKELAAKELSDGKKHKKPLAPESSLAVTKATTTTTTDTDDKTDNKDTTTSMDDSDQTSPATTPQEPEVQLPVPSSLAWPQHDQLNQDGRDYISALFVYIVSQMLYDCQLYTECQTLIEQHIFPTAFGNLQQYDYLSSKLLLLVSYVYEKHNNILLTPACRSHISLLLTQAVTRSLPYTISTCIVITLRSFILSKHYKLAYDYLHNVTFPPGENVETTILDRYQYYCALIYTYLLQYNKAYDYLDTLIRNTSSTYNNNNSSSNTNSNTNISSNNKQVSSSSSKEGQQSTTTTPSATSSSSSSSSSSSQRFSSFHLHVYRLYIIVSLLLGNIPSKSIFYIPPIRLNLSPYYLQITNAIRLANIQQFESILYKPDAITVFQNDGVLTLLHRLRHVVLRAGLCRITSVYSRLSLQQLKNLLKLDTYNDDDITTIVKKSISDGAINAIYDDNTHILSSQGLSMDSSNNSSSSTLTTTTTNTQSAQQQQQHNNITSMIHNIDPALSNQYKLISRIQYIQNVSQQSQLALRYQNTSNDTNHNLNPKQQNKHSSSQISSLM